MVNLAEGIQSFQSGVQFASTLKDFFNRGDRERQLNAIIEGMQGRDLNRNDVIQLAQLVGPELAKAIMGYEMHREELHGVQLENFVSEMGATREIGFPVLEAMMGAPEEDRMEIFSDFFEPYVGNERAKSAIKPLIEMFMDGDFSDEAMDRRQTFFRSTERIDELQDARTERTQAVADREDEQAHDLAKIQAEAKATVQTARDKDTYAKEMAQQHGGSWQDWRVFLFNMKELEANEGDLTGMGGGGAFINPATGRPLDLGSYTGGSQDGIGGYDDPLAVFD